MDHYIDIAVLPDPEFTTPTLMSVLFGKFHNALVAWKNLMIGVSFPDMGQDKPSLGSRLRLHGGADSLSQLMGGADWLGGMRDHCRVGRVLRVPDTADHRVVCRVQTKSSPERLRRRLMKRKGISEEEARKAIPDNIAKRLNLPFVSLKSKSTGQPFYLFIEQRPIMPTSVEGEFSRYGLSSIATVPWF